MDKLNNTLKIVDLFAGAGGLSLGFDLFENNSKRVFELFRAVEWDNNACNTLRQNLSKLYNGKNVNDIVIEGDITRKEVHKKLINDCKNVKISVVVGGPPCQSFSLLGKRTEGDQKDVLYKEYLEIVNELNPDFIVFENVKGIISKKDKETDKSFIDIIVEDFHKLGYRFKYSDDYNGNRDYIILNAADYGVPQKRERVLLIGSKENLNAIIPYPVPTHYNPQKETCDDKLPYVTVRDAIGDLPELYPKCTKNNISEEQLIEVDKLNKNAAPGDDIVPYHLRKFKEHYNKSAKQGQEFLDFIKPPDVQIDYLLHHKCRSQMLSDIKLFEIMKEGQQAKDIYLSNEYPLEEKKWLLKYNMNSFKDKYRKQKFDEPSTTIFAHLERDGNRFIHPDSKQHRTFTPREAARLQSFPDWYEFCGTGNRKFRYIGNAVPPLLARKIAECIYLAIINLQNK